MKKSFLSRLAQVLPFVVSAAALTSWKTPPNQAMRVIRSKGFFSYWGEEHSAIQPCLIADSRKKPVEDREFIG